MFVTLKQHIYSNTENKTV